MSSPRVAPMPRRKGVRNYIKLCFERNAVTSMVGCTCFCMVTDFWYIVVMPKNLAVRSPIMGCFFSPRTFLLSAAGPPKFRWFKPAKSKGKVHERNPKAETKGESQRLRALTSLEVDWGWWGRLLVGRGVALGVAEPPRRWPVHPPATRAKKPRRRACLRGRGWLTNG